MDPVSDCCGAYFTSFLFYWVSAPMIFILFILIAQYCTVLFTYFWGTQYVKYYSKQHRISFAIVDSKYYQATTLFRSCTPPCTDSVTGRIL